MATKQKDAVIKNDTTTGLNLSAMLAASDGAKETAVAGSTDIDAKKTPETEVAAVQGGPTGGTDVLDPSHPDYKAPGITEEPATATADPMPGDPSADPGVPTGDTSTSQPAWSTAETLNDEPLTPFEVVKRQVIPDADGRAPMPLDDCDEILGVSFINGELFVNVLSYQPENPNKTWRFLNVVASGVKWYKHPGRYIGSVTVPHNGLVLSVFEEMYSDEPVVTTDDIDFSGLAVSQ